MIDFHSVHLVLQFKNHILYIQAKNLVWASWAMHEEPVIRCKILCMTVLFSSVPRTPIHYSYTFPNHAFGFSPQINPTQSHLSLLLSDDQKVTFHIWSMAVPDLVLPLRRSKYRLCQSKFISDLKLANESQRWLKEPLLTRLYIISIIMDQM